jgi:hypothetical protein
MMDASLKAKWTAALRSGAYKQAKGFLKTSEGFCCIGVLGDIQGIDWNTFEREEDLSVCTLGGTYDALDWDARQKLANMNDGGENSFAEIADFIDANH